MYQGAFEVMLGSKYPADGRKHSELNYYWFIYRLGYGKALINLDSNFFQWAKCIQ